MGRIVYCKNDFVPEEKASISIFDRGFLFGDAIYEVTAVIANHMIDNCLHLDRMERCLAALSMPRPMPRAEIERIQTELMLRNGLSEGLIYMQISRGEADRSFAYAEGLATNLIMFTQEEKLIDTTAQKNGISIKFAADERWSRRDIKTSMLLSQVLAKQEANAQGYDDAWLVEDGLVTEGVSSTAFIITASGHLVTRPNSSTTLPGCTRHAVLRLCRDHDLSYSEYAFSPADAQAAVEAFVTSASSFVTPVVRINDTIVGDGQPGPITRRLQSYYLEEALRVEPVAPS